MHRELQQLRDRLEREKEEALVREREAVKIRAARQAEKDEELFQEEVRMASGLINRWIYKQIDCSTS